MRNRYRLRESFYYACFQFCASFTNWHVQNVPLCAEDGEFEQNYRRKLRADFGRAAANRRRRANEARNNRMIRIRADIGDLDDLESSKSSTVNNSTGIIRTDNLP